MRTLKEHLGVILPGTNLMAVGALLMVATMFVTELWTWQWCALFGSATVFLLLGMVNLVEKWTDKRGFWDD